MWGWIANAIGHFILAGALAVFVAVLLLGGTQNPAPFHGAGEIRCLANWLQWLRRWFQVWTPGSCESPSEELLEWLTEHGLRDLGAQLAWCGCPDVPLLRELTDDEIEDLLQAVQPKAGHKARLRRAIKKLRLTRTGTDCEQAPTLLEPVSQEVVGLGQDHAASSTSLPLEVTEARGGDEAPGVPPEISEQAPAASAPGESSSGPAAALSVGSRIRVQGLMKNPSLNGKYGRLVSFDPGAGRWEVALEEGRGTIKVRPENLQQPEPVPTAASSSASQTSPHIGGTASSSSSSRPSSMPQAEAASHAPDHDVPEEFRCCITREIMELPVITSDGHTYERSAIAKWLEDHSTSPKTGQLLPDKVLRPNHAIRAQIIAWRERTGLPPLPPWEPEPQETVPTRQPMPQQAPGVTLHLGGQDVVLPLTPGPTVVVHHNLQLGQPVQPHLVGGAPQLVPLLHSQPSLREQLRALVPQAPADPEGLARLVSQDQHLQEIVVRWLQANPAATAQVHVGPQAENPFFRAAREGECGVLERLLQAHPGEHMRQLSADGDSLLHVASWFGHARIVSMLIARGHPVHLQCRNQSAPLHYAAFRGHVDVTRVLLEARADPERRMFGGDVALHQAAWQGHMEVITTLLSARASIKATKDDGDSAVALAAFRGHANVCRELIRLAASVSGAPGPCHRNHRGHTPLHAGAAGGNLDVVKCLLEMEANVNARTDTEETALHRAVQNRAPEATLSALLEARAEVEVARLDDDHTPLQLAVLEARSSIVRLLIRHGASPHRARRDGTAPLHLAVLREAAAPLLPNEGPLVAELVTARADANVRTRSELTPLHVALGPLQQAPHRTSALRSILDGRADVGAPLKDGERPLHIAVFSNFRAEVALLLERRAQVNQPRQDGCTALHLAAQQGASACVERLLEARADLSCRNEIGDLPSDVARKSGHEHISQLLRAAA